MRTVADEMLRQATESTTVETGGILIGPVRGRSRIVVTHLTGPGPKAVRQRGFFHRDTAYCQEILNSAYLAHGWDYVGEWHTHVVPLDRPSTGDLNTLAGIMADADYGFRHFAMLLILASRQPVELRAFVAADGVIRAAKARLFHSLEEVPVTD